MSSQETNIHLSSDLNFAVLTVVTRHNMIRNVVGIDLTYACQQYIHLIKSFSLLRILILPVGNGSGRTLNQII